MADFLMYGGALTIAFGILAGLWQATRITLRLMRGVLRFLDDWQGEPARPGLPAGRPGFPERLATLEFVVAAVHTELHPNSGKTFRDAVDRALATKEGTTP